MNKTIEIKKDDALKAHKNTNKKGKKLLEDLFGEKTFRGKVTDRIKTIKDVLHDNGLSEETFNIQCRDLPEDEKAYRLIKLIVKSLNEGWLPDWSNSNEYKYYPWFDMNNGSAASRFSYNGYGRWNAGSLVGSRLCFKNAELAKYTGTQFIEIYRKNMVIN